MKEFKIFSICIFFLISIFAFCNDAPIPLVSFDRIPDSTEIRKKIANNWLLADPQIITEQTTVIKKDSKGNRFKIRSVYLKEKNELAVVISPVDTEFSDFKKVPQGTWILYKDYATGEDKAIKIFPRENPELYLELKPHKKTNIDYYQNNKNYTEEQGKTLVNICLYNAFVRKEIAIGIPFNSLYYLSLMELKENTKNILPWEIFDPPVAYSSIEASSDIIRERLHKLVYIEDGAFDEFGNPVHLRTGKPQTQDEIIANIQPKQKLSEIKGGVNCSGFVKWIVDGIIKPIAGQGTYIKPLITKTDVPDTFFTKPYEYKQLYFGLKWIRHLASAALSLNVKRTVLPSDAGIDVKIEPFALVPPVNRQNKAENKQEFFSFKGYEKNAGYQTEYLQALLYYLAITEPGHFYLGTVNNEMGNPKLRQYYHVAAFFPYFDIFGNFHIAVFESAAETSIEQFTRVNAGAFTALVRIRAPQIGLFNP